MLEQAGLGYIHLGQSATTLSGGEAQRIAFQGASRRTTGKTLHILDEPTTGLHRRHSTPSISCRLVEIGNTVIVIEHNPEIIKCRLHYRPGPEGGFMRPVASGTPEVIARAKTLTGKYLPSTYRDKIQRQAMPTASHPFSRRSSKYRIA